LLAFFDILPPPRVWLRFSQRPSLGCASLGGRAVSGGPSGSDGRTTCPGRGLAGGGAPGAGVCTGSWGHCSGGASRTGGLSQAGRVSRCRGRRRSGELLVAYAWPRLCAGRHCGSCSWRHRWSCFGVALRGPAASPLRGAATQSQ